MFPLLITIAVLKDGRTETGEKIHVGWKNKSYFEVNTGAISNYISARQKHRFIWKRHTILELQRKNKVIQSEWK